MAKEVFAITERTMRDGEMKTFWTKVGAAFENSDGSLSIMLDAFPVSGKLQVREREPRPEGGGTSRRPSRNRNWDE